MGVDSKYELKIGESLESVDIEEHRDGVTPTDLVSTPEAVLEALKATTGADQILERIPTIEAAHAWVKTAYFSVCSKSGSARYLDIWDADHFDGFTDMQRCLSDCRAWFSGDGYTTWGSGQTKTGRVNCYFNAPVAGSYVCNASLQSFPASSGATVECLIDSFSFGPLPFTGTVNQPHPCNLSAGGHHFRIRQMSGSFFFLSLTVFRV
jgi:hypothetical protein